MTFDPVAEIDRQLQNIKLRGYPPVPAALKRTLRQAVVDYPGELAAPTPGQAPFVLVTPAQTAETITTLTLAGKSKPGKVDRNYKPGEPANFGPVVDLPERETYLLFDIERGEEFCNITPSSALSTLAGRGRTPLTIAEGLALLTHHPQMLEKNKCFMLAGSSCGDRRVPALWISEGAPKLGWCWLSNPHTWLGTASGAARL